MSRPPPRSPLFPYTTLFRSTPLDSVDKGGARELRFGGSSEFFHELMNQPYLSFLILLAFVAFNAALLIGLSHLLDRKSTRLNSSHQIISYAVFCLKKKTHEH